MKSLQIAFFCAALAASAAVMAQTVPGGSTTTTGVPGSATRTTGVPGGATTTTGVPGGNTTTTGIPGSNTVTNTTSPLTTLSFQSVDVNNDSQLTKQEFEASGLSESLFVTIDSDHNGVVTQAELNAFGPVMRPNP
ncbi:MAG: hypothetical protein ACAH83_11155 [Alphaproteobacteria bacterium]